MNLAVGDLQRSAGDRWKDRSHERRTLGSGNYSCNRRGNGHDRAHYLDVGDHGADSTGSRQEGEQGGGYDRSGASSDSRQGKRCCHSCCHGAGYGGRREGLLSSRPANHCARPHGKPLGICGQRAIDAIQKEDRAEMGQTFRIAVASKVHAVEVGTSPRLPLSI